VPLLSYSLNRIYPFCNKLAQLWLTKCPDWRFSQLVCNFLESDLFNDKISFYTEDEEFLTLLEKFFSLNNLYRKTPDGTSVPILPDYTISHEDMVGYGYTWDGMLPMNKTAAGEVFKHCVIYRLYPDDTEVMVDDCEEIIQHASLGGIFGVEKADWQHFLNNEPSLKVYG